MRQLISILIPITLVGCASQCDKREYTENPCPSTVEVATAQEWRKLEDQFLYTHNGTDWTIDQRANPSRQPVSELVNWIVFKCEHRITCHYDQGVLATVSTRKQQGRPL